MVWFSTSPNRVFKGNSSLKSLQVSLSCFEECGGEEKYLYAKSTDMINGQYETSMVPEYGPGDPGTPKPMQM